MRKTVCLIAAIALISPFQNLLAHTKILKGALTTHGSTAVDHYRLFFGGYRTLTDGEGFFSFPLEFVPCTPLYLLISEGAKWTYDRTNTIATLSQDPSAPYLFYLINYVGDDNDILIATPERLESRNFQIPPEFCLVLPLDPTRIAALEPWRSPKGDPVARFPKIVLKELPVGKHHPATESILASMEATPFHEKSSETTKCTQNRRQQPVTISITR